MSIRLSIAILTTFAALSTSFGCNIEHCEEGADCADGEHGSNRPELDTKQTCTVYCGRVSVCGGSQADDFEGCISACENRFEVLPEDTARLCTCAEWSLCTDVNEGRCSQEPSGSGGTGSGGTGTCSGSCGSAGSPGSAGTSSSGGEGGSAGSPATPCSGDCDCSAGASCVDGYCTL